MRALLPRTKEATGDAAASGSSPSRVDEPARPGKTVSSGGRERRLPPPLHLQFMPHRGLAASPGSCRIITGRKPEPTEMGERNPVVVDVWSRVDVEPWWDSRCS